MVLKLVTTELHNAVNDHPFSCNLFSPPSLLHALLSFVCRFWWFGHIFNHAQPHLASSDHLKQCMTDNVNFAKVCEC